MVSLEVSGMGLKHGYACCHICFQLLVVDRVDGDVSSSGYKDTNILILLVKIAW